MLFFTWFLPLYSNVCVCLQLFLLIYSSSKQLQSLTSSLSTTPLGKNNLLTNTKPRKLLQSHDTTTTSTTVCSDSEEIERLCKTPLCAEEDPDDHSNSPLTSSLSCSSAAEPENIGSDRDSNPEPLEHKQMAALLEKAGLRSPDKAMIVNCTSGYVRRPIKWGEVPVTIAKHYKRFPIQDAMRYPNCKIIENK